MFKREKIENELKMLLEHYFKKKVVELSGKGYKEERSHHSSSSEYSLMY